MWFSKLYHHHSKCSSFSCKHFQLVYFQFHYLWQHPDNNLCLSITMKMILESIFTFQYQRFQKIISSHWHSYHVHFSRKVHKRGISSDRFLTFYWNSLSSKAPSPSIRTHSNHRDIEFFMFLLVRIYFLRESNFFRLWTFLD